MGSRRSVPSNRLVTLAGHRPTSYMQNRRNPTSFTAWIRAVPVGDSDRFCWTVASMPVSAHWLRPRCSRVPNKWRFECPPTLETGQGRVCPDVGIKSHNKYQAIVTDASNSESGDTDRSPCGTHNTGTSPQLRRGVPGWPLHSTPLHSTPKRLPSDRPHTNSNGRLAWESVTLTLPTQRCGAVGFLPSPDAVWRAVTRSVTTPSGGGGCQ